MYDERECMPIEVSILEVYDERGDYTRSVLRER